MSRQRTRAAASEANRRLPSGWQVRPLENICTFASGGTPAKSRPEYWAGPIPWASPKDLKVTRLRDTEDHISPAGLEAGSTLAPRHAVLVVVRGMILARDVPMALAEVPIAFNQDLKAVISGGAVSPDYLLYAMLASKGTLLQKVGRSAHGTRTLLSKDLAMLEVPVPPPDEQRRIAAVLGLIERAMALESRAAAAMQQLRGAALDHVFTTGLGASPEGDNEISDVPATWFSERLDACCKVVSSSMSYTDFSSAPEGSEKDELVMGIKVSDMNLPGNEIEIKSANLAKRISREVAQRRAVPPGTVVFPKRGAAIATNKKRITTAWTILDPNLIGVEAGDIIESRFLYHWFQRFDLRTITEPGPTPQLNKKNLVPLLISHPPTKEEQREIATALDTVDLALSAHARRREVLSELFACLLDKLIAGEIRVDKLDIDTSEVAA